MFEDLLDVALSWFGERVSWIVAKSELQLTPGDFRPAMYVAARFCREPLLATAGFVHKNVVSPHWEVFRDAPRFLQVWAVLALVCFVGDSFGVSGMETASKLLVGAMLALLAILCAALGVKRGIGWVRRILSER